MTDTGELSELPDLELVARGQAFGGGGLGVRRGVRASGRFVEVARSMTAAGDVAAAVDVTAEVDAVQPSMLWQFGMPQSSHVFGASRASPEVRGGISCSHAGASAFAP